MPHPTAPADHEPIYEQDYGCRFLCACGISSPFWTTRQTAEAMHAWHVEHAHEPLTHGHTPRA